MYALVDCNNFYVSCERVFQPQWNEKPVVVLSNNDGCIISRSEEAKMLGVPMGTPEFQARRLIQEHNIKVFSSNYPLYGDLSDRVMSILNQFTPHIEIYSIDEAFLYFGGMDIADFQLLGLQIKERIQKWLGLPISVGFAPSKALAKIANKIARKFPDKTGGSYIIDSEEKRIKALKWTKIEDVWGIGYRLSGKMRTQNIRTAYDFTLLQYEPFIKKQMGITGLRLKYELEGTPVLELEEPETKKNIAITRSFEKDITELEALRERIATFAGVCAEKLRKQNSYCYSLIVYIRKGQTTQKKNTSSSVSKMVSLPCPTSSSLTIVKAAVNLLENLFEENTVYKKAGVIVTQLTSAENRQFCLFDEEDSRHRQLMQVIDNFHKKTGEKKIRLGNQDLKRTWKMKQNHLSPKYTTRINEILNVQCH